MQIRLSVLKVPFLDTGIGREAGYANDEEFIQDCMKQRAKLDPRVRDILDDVSKRLDEEFINGKP
jgi:hypothetical protein